MSLRQAGIAVVLTILVGIFPCAAEPTKAGDQPPPGATGTQRVVRYATRSGNTTRTAQPTRPRTGPNVPPAGNPPEMNVGYLMVQAADGRGPVVKMLVTEELRQSMSELVLEHGQLITITVKPNPRGGTEIVSALTPFDGPRWLARPRVYLFDGTLEQKVGVQSFTAVRLSRFGEPKQVLVPNRLAAAGATPQADDAILTQVKALAAGDAVEVTLADGPIKGAVYIGEISAVHDPIIGDFVKLATIKDLAGRLSPGVVLDVDGHERSFTLPLAAPGMKPPAAAAAAAIHALSKKLKPGFAVRLFLRDPAATAPVIREMELDGDVEPINEKSFSLATTYATVTFAPGVSRFDGPLIVGYSPGSHRPEDRYLDLGVSRLLDFKEEAARLNLTTDQLRTLRSARDHGNFGYVSPTPQEKAVWATAYNAYTAAKDEPVREKFEQEMFAAAHELAARWRADIRNHYLTIRATLTAEQLKDAVALGQKKQMVKFD